MKIETRPFGTSGLNISVMGFGAWGIGGDSYGPIEEKDAIFALETAFEKGINFYDTADLYGAGRSEEILGKVFKNKRDKVIIASKFGTLPHTGRAMPQDFSPENVKKCIENSLRRLNTNYIDLYQFHSPLLSDLEDDRLWVLLEDFKKSGKIRAYGASMRSPKDALEVLKKYPVSGVQVNFNMIDQRAIECGLTETAIKLKKGIIARTPLCFGFLTGKLSIPKQGYSANEHLRMYPKEQILRWSESTNLFSDLYKKKKHTPTECAIRYCIDTPGISTVIPGMLNTEQVLENLESLNKEPLNISDLEEIKNIYTGKIFFDSSLANRPKS